MRRLNWGCGPGPAAGWLNSDRNGGPGIEIVRDIRDGLPLEPDSVDYIVSIHAFQDLSFLDIVPSLQELHRVLAPGGVLRLGLPDLDRAIQAYVAGDRDYFYIPDADATSLGGKLIAQIIWYGSVRTPFTFDFVAEALGTAGFRAVHRCRFGETLSPFPEITTLDNRERESLFVEAVK
jgi:SAM-dependent methyltransferase